MMQELFRATQEAVTGIISFQMLHNRLLNRVEAARPEQEGEEEVVVLEEEQERQEVAGEEDKVDGTDPSLVKGEGEKVEPTPLVCKQEVLKKGSLVAKKWRLVEKLGEGGFGVVWSAQRVEKKKRIGRAKKKDTVALKVSLLPCEHQEEHGPGVKRAFGLSCAESFSHPDSHVCVFV